MSIFGKLFDRSVLLALRAFTRELKASRLVQQSLVDSYRAAHGMPPLYSPPEAILDPIRVLPEATAGKFLKSGDNQTVWLIQELAREHRVPMTVDTDLEKLAIDMGWADAEGKFLMIPTVALGLPIGE